MTRIVCALVALSFAAALAAPAAAEPRVKKKRYYTKAYAAQSSRVNASGYYEMNADKLPTGTARWWHQMDHENRGGR